MLPKLFLSLFSLLAGGWMLVDGLHVLLRGKYIGPEKPGPWSIPFTFLGINPFRLGPLFILFGLLWLTFLIALLTGNRWGWHGLLVIAIASLWYLPLGTLLSLLTLALLLFTSVRTTGL